MIFSLHLTSINKYPNYIKIYLEAVHLLQADITISISTDIIGRPGTERRPLTKFYPYQNPRKPYEFVVVLKRWEFLTLKAADRWRESS